jgi:hypothetical protein
MNNALVFGNILYKRRFANHSGNRTIFFNKSLVLAQSGKR